MYTLVLSTLFFHALATVAFVVGVAADSFVPARRAQG